MLYKLTVLSSGACVFSAKHYVDLDVSLGTVPLLINAKWAF